jgi:hypothetical protein
MPIHPDVKPVIAGSANVTLDTGDDQNEITSVLTTICKIQNYRAIHVPLGESLGKRKQATLVGYCVPVTIPGVYHGLRTFYVIDIRESNLFCYQLVLF